MGTKTKTASLSYDQPQLIGVDLKSDETLVGVDMPEPSQVLLSLSALQAILNLTDVRRIRDVGTNGPSIASDDFAEEGMPEQGLYDVFFPRDAFVVAEMLAAEHPELTQATIMAAFEAMGTKDNYQNPVRPFDEQEIGKIPHELRSSDDPIAKNLTREKDWGWPYYGAIDTTGKNILAVVRYVERSGESEKFLHQTFIGRDGRERTVKEGFDMNVAWLLGRMGLNPEGLVESLSKNPKHHANQSWADSPESFHHADGSWAEHHPEKNLGVAALEQQGEAYKALRSAARLYERLGETNKASNLHRRAENLRRIVLDHFWVEDKSHFEGYFGRGTDRDKEGNLHVLAIRSSDMGLFLATGILDDTEDENLNNELRFKREATIKNLLSEELMGLNGIRTLSSDSVRYSPDRYHNGTTWPWVSYLTAEAFRRYGYEKEAGDLEKRVMDACEETGVLAEYFSGSNDPDSRLVTQRVIVSSSTIATDPVYAVSQPPQKIQAWTVAAVLAIKLRAGEKTTIPTWTN